MAGVDELRKYLAPHRRFVMDLEVQVDREKKAKPVDANLYLFCDLLVILFAKAVRTKGARKNIELAWPVGSLLADVARRKLEPQRLSPRVGRGHPG